ncbi:Clathrin adaptor, mu subunit family and Clathrin adaptor, mu subunit, C-terminal domain and Longin-like domain-containing protein [Strongyloides ratti]|uniref:Clathrin adaptor, mu subunit family and Clathrin adaptor, mu subunit, C-terminal domain and Longin-like domain-containing protein n=1 Tax=Strongyloides ratti TaxID=34506 RepID=A0A090LFG4_STRRB|nr:Clathrin adaptor, mu subunit family and Clathrin adaptor, mu subunit, C-terminal domain and Longin-like domain-containing protein [Strongyloides ratti]CEF68536.1 Clathrin adaptor, mu subunit family and Clathrin adaptor, mu subunit, C-terminal domain and Longin-like domain-containing protein [Strongyloides ratti]
MTCSAIYFCDENRKSLISKIYRETTSSITIFREYLWKNQDALENMPFFIFENNFYMYIKINDIYIIGVMEENNTSNVMLIITFLYKIKDLLVSLLGELTAINVNKNLIYIYELLDEILDFGYPQISEINVLKSYVMQNGKKTKRQIMVPPTVTNAVNWRVPNIYHLTNEVGVKLTEKIDITINKEGSIVEYTIKGFIDLFAQLSGMPKVTFKVCEKFKELLGTRNIYDHRGFHLDNIKFHHCIFMTKFEDYKEIQCIPPEGKTNLISYQLTPEFSLKPIIECNCTLLKPSSSRVIYNLSLKSNYRAYRYATFIQVAIPISRDCFNLKYTSSFGKIIHQKDNNALIWMFKNYPGQKASHSRAEFSLSTIKSEIEEKIPRILTLQFTINDVLMSDVSIKSVNISEKYDVVAYCQTKTSSGNYTIRF